MHDATIAGSNVIQYGYYAFLVFPPLTYGPAHLRTSVGFGKEIIPNFVVENDSYYVPPTAYGLNEIRYCRLFIGSLGAMTAVSISNGRSRSETP